MTCGWGNDRILIHSSLEPDQSQAGLSLHKDRYCIFIPSPFSISRFIVQTTAFCLSVRTSQWRLQALKASKCTISHSNGFLMLCRACLLACPPRMKRTMPKATSVGSYAAELTAVIWVLRKTSAVLSLRNKAPASHCTPAVVHLHSPTERLVKNANDFYKLTGVDHASFHTMAKRNSGGLEAAVINWRM